MSGQAVATLLERALRLSQELAQLADAGDVAAAAALDAERRRLLREARAATGVFSAPEQALLAGIAALNDRALGRLEHRLRSKARELDIAMTGRRAVAAYAATG
jgi:hypothetical protein